MKAEGSQAHTLEGRAFAQWSTLAMHADGPSLNPWHVQEGLEKILNEDLVEPLPDNSGVMQSRCCHWSTISALQKETMFLCVAIKLGSPTLLGLMAVYQGEVLSASHSSEQEADHFGLHWQ